MPNVESATEVFGPSIVAIPPRTARNDDVQVALISVLSHASKLALRTESLMIFLSESGDAMSTDKHMNRRARSAAESAKSLLKQLSEFKTNIKAAIDDGDASSRNE